MQTVCDQKFYGMFADNTETRSRSEIALPVMPAHEKLLARQLFWGGLAVSGIMLVVIRALGLS